MLWYCSCTGYIDMDIIVNIITLVRTLTYCELTVLNIVEAEERSDTESP